MKIASVTFSPMFNNVGGAVIPSIAFKQWCDYFSETLSGFDDFPTIECEVIGVVPSNTIAPPLIDGVDRIMSDSSYEHLNKYDAIFFNTPPIYAQLDPKMIRVPFVIMIHGESDYDLYGKSIIDGFTKHPKCVGIAHIDPKRKDGLFWHPCTTIDSLISRTIQNRTGTGMLYAARIRNWLNPHLFLKCAADNADLIKNAMIMGPISPKHIGSIEKHAERNNNTSYRLGAFHKGYPLALPRDKWSLYWDVAGSAAKPLKFNRLSLSGYEALKNGFMPIIQKGTAPAGLEGHLIEVDVNNFDNGHFRNQLIKHFLKPHDKWIKINYEIRYGNTITFSKNQVAEQVYRIIDVLTKGVNNGQN